jgi:hypothetical protein
MIHVMDGKRMGMDAFVDTGRKSVLSFPIKGVDSK